MIDRSTIDRIFASADIVDVVGEFVTLKRKGVNYNACCPFHSEKTPSFVVSPSKGLYKCFGCGKGGNAVSFVMEHEKMTYPEALKWMAKRYNIEIQEEALSEQQLRQNDDRQSMMALNAYAGDWFVENLHTPKGEAVALSYLRERGLSDATIATFGLGYNPEGGDTFSRAAIKAGYKEEFMTSTGLTIVKERGGYYDRFNGRVMFPILSVSGRTIGFGGRTLSSDKKTAKYLNSPESEIYHKSQTLYGIWQAKKAITRLDSCILVEGYLDVIQFHQAGLENVVASSGTSLTVEQIQLLSRFTRNVVVIYDGDSAGIKASMRGIDMLLTQGLSVRSVLLPAGDDPDTFARRHTLAELEDFIEQNQQDFISFKVNLLLKDASDDPIKKAAVVSDIIGTIALVPQAVERSLYIKQCSRMLELSEDLLSDEVRRKMMSKVDGGQWQRAVGARASFNASGGAGGSHGGGFDAPPHDMFADGPGSSEYDGLGDSTGHAMAVLPPVERELKVLEVELLEYLLKYGEREFDLVTSPSEIETLPIAETIIAELSADNIEFTDELHRKVYLHYLDMRKEVLEGGSVPTSVPISASTFAHPVSDADSDADSGADSGADSDEADFVPDPAPELDLSDKIMTHMAVHCTDAEVASFVAQMVFDDTKYTLSALWQRSEVMEMPLAERLSIAIPKALDTYKQKVVNHMIHSKIVELTSTDLSEDRVRELLQEIDELNQLRNSVCDQYERLL